MKIVSKLRDKSLESLSLHDAHTHRQRMPNVISPVRISYGYATIYRVACDDNIFLVWRWIRRGGTVKWHFASVPYSQMNAECDRMLDEQENVQLIEHATLSILTHFSRFR